MKAKKIKMTSTGVHMIERLVLRFWGGAEVRLKDPIFHSFDNADPKRLVTILRKQDFEYSETSLGYVWKFEPDDVDNCGVVGKVYLGMDESGEGSYTIIDTDDIIGWAYCDEQLNAQ